MEKGCRSPAALSMFSQGFLRGGNNVFDVKYCQCVLRSSFVELARWNSTDAKRVYYSGGCAALRRLRKRLPISAWSGENATGGADGFLWRGCATTPARSAGQQGLGKALPNK